jgi:hypothetical protein
VARRKKLQLISFERSGAAIEKQSKTAVLAVTFGTGRWWVPAVETLAPVAAEMRLAEV